MMVQGTVKVQGLTLQLKPITMKLLSIKIPVRDFTRGLHSKQQKKVTWQSRLEAKIAGLTNRFGTAHTCTLTETLSTACLTRERRR